MKSTLASILFWLVPILCYSQEKPYQIVLIQSDTAALIPIEDYRPLVYASVKERECRVAIKYVREENESFHRENESLRGALNHSKEAEQKANVALAQSDTIQANQSQIVDGYKAENMKLKRENRLIKIGGIILVAASLLIAI